MRGFVVKDRDLKVLNKIENFGSRDHSRGSAFLPEQPRVADPRISHVIIPEGPQCSFVLIQELKINMCVLKKDLEKDDWNLES